MMVYLFILALLQPQAHKQTHSWIKIDEKHIPSNTENWAIDGLGNYYFCSNQEIIKTNSEGKKLYQMSLKKQGEISKIVHINALKMLMFSEIQQQICFFDNTLSNNGNCIQMEDINLQNVKLIGNSNRPNLVWLYDEYNSGLYLYDYVNNKIIQSVSNMSSLVGLKDIYQIIEIESNLYVSDEYGKMVMFDLFLNQTYSFQLPIKEIQQWGNHIVGISDDKLCGFSLRGEEKFILDLPIESKELVVVGEYYYFKSSNKIIKYQLKLN